MVYQRFIRYPNSCGCFCEKCRRGFERETGKPVADWPDDCIEGMRHAESIEFRCHCISALVHRISTRVREVNPKVKIRYAGWLVVEQDNSPTPYETSKVSIAYLRGALDAL